MASSAKLKITGISSAFRAIELVIEETTKREQFLKGLGDFAANRVRAQTRSGINLETGGAIKAHSPGYAEFRRKVASGIISGMKIDGNFFKVGLSNITFSGQLLSSIRSKVFANSRRIEVFPTGKRSKVGTEGMFSGESLSTNEEVTKSLSERGFRFLYLDKLGRMAIRKMVLDELRRAFRRV